MITIKLTKREAECAMDAIAQISQEYTGSWDHDTQQINGGKRYYNALESASKKIYKATKEEIWGI